MKKSNALARLAQLKINVTDQEIKDINIFSILDILLDYIGDSDIRQSVEEIPK